jgi:hypothetical protein
MEWIKDEDQLIAQERGQLRWLREKPAEVD